MATSESKTDQHMLSLLVVMKFYPQMAIKMLYKYPPNEVLTKIEDDSDNENNFRSKLTITEKKLISTLRTEGFNKMDISWLYKLIRYFNLVPKPSKNWGKRPLDTDTNHGDDMQRMLNNRNNLVHRPIGHLSVEEAGKILKESIEIAHRMDEIIDESTSSFEIEIKKARIHHFTEKEHKEAVAPCVKLQKQKDMSEKNHFDLYYGDDIAAILENQNLSATDSTRYTLYIRDLTNLDVSAIIEKLEQNKKCLNEKSYDIKLLDAQNGSLVLHVEIPNLCFITKDSLHKAIAEFLRRVFTSISDSLDQHIKEVVLAECDSYIISDNEEENDEYLNDQEPSILKLDVMVRNTSLQSKTDLYRDVHGFISKVLDVTDKDVESTNGSPLAVIMTSQHVDDSSPSGTPEKKKLVDYKIDPDQLKLIKEDEGNKILWNEAKVFTKEGVQEPEKKPEPMKTPAPPKVPQVDGLAIKEEEQEGAAITALLDDNASSFKQARAKQEDERMAEVTTSRHESNYIKITMLVLNIFPRAVRVQFDKEFNPVHLQRTLKSNFGRLADLQKKKRITQPQWNLLFPRTGEPSSKDFNITLMICLLRNLMPIDIMDRLPSATDTRLGADLSRIKYYKNLIAHCDSPMLDDTDFESYWNDVTPAILRLGGNSLKAECDDWYGKNFDAGQKELEQEQRTELAEMKKKLIELEQEQSNPVPKNIREQEEKERIDMERQINEERKYKETIEKSEKDRDIETEERERMRVDISSSGAMGKEDSNMFYRLLRPDESYEDGLRAKNPNSTRSVFDHVISRSGEQQSKYISTCGSWEAVHSFRNNSDNPGLIVKIKEDTLPLGFEIIDLRRQENRNNYIKDYMDTDSIEQFNNLANTFQEVLLVGYVPGECIKLCDD